MTLYGNYESLLINFVEYILLVSWYSQQEQESLIFE